MRTTKLIRMAVAAVLITVGSTMFTSCDDDFWAPMPPSGWNSFTDARLFGNWKLIQANSQPVYGDATNYMVFNRGGRGTYYYYNRGRLYYEDIAYWCQQAGNYVSNNQINIQYYDGSASTMNYWFSDGNSRLWMQWSTGGGTVTYVYAYTPSIP